MTSAPRQVRCHIGEMYEEARHVHAAEAHDNAAALSRSLRRPGGQSDHRSRKLADTRISEDFRRRRGRANAWRPRETRPGNNVVIEPLMVQWQGNLVTCGRRAGRKADRSGRRSKKGERVEIRERRSAGSLIGGMLIAVGLTLVFGIMEWSFSRTSSILGMFGALIASTYAGVDPLIAAVAVGAVVETAGGGGGGEGTMMRPILHAPAASPSVRDRRA